MKSMTFDLAVVTAFVALMLSSLNLVAVIRTMLSAGEKKLDERLTKAEGKLVEYDRRIQSLEGELKHLPDKSTAHRLELAMERITGRLDTLNEKLKPIEATNERLNELLIEQAAQGGKR